MWDLRKALQRGVNGSKQEVFMDGQEGKYCLGRVSVCYNR